MPHAGNIVDYLWDMLAALKKGRADRAVDARDVRAAISILQQLKSSIGSEDTFGIADTVQRTATRLFTGRKTQNGGDDRIEQMFGLFEDRFGNLPHGTNIEVKEAFFRDTAHTSPPRTAAGPQPVKEPPEKTLPPNDKLQPQLSRRLFLGLTALTGGALATNPAAAIAKLASVSGRDLYVQGFNKAITLQNEVIGYTFPGFKGSYKGLGNKVDDFASSLLYGALSPARRHLGLRTGKDDSSVYNEMSEVRPGIVKDITEGLAARNESLIDAFKYSPSYFGTPESWKDTIDQVGLCMPGIKTDMRGALDDAIGGLQQMLADGSYATGTLSSMVDDLAWIATIQERQVLKPARVATILGKYEPGYREHYADAALSEVTRWITSIRDKVLPGSPAETSSTHQLDLSSHIHEGKKMQALIEDIRLRHIVPDKTLDDLAKQIVPLREGLQKEHDRLAPSAPATIPPAPPIDDLDWIESTHSYASRISWERNKAGHEPEL